MGYNPSDSSGTDDDLPMNHLNKDTRGGHTTGSGKNAVKGGLQSSNSFKDMEIRIHQLEQEAYCSVLKAFKAQSDAITWEKESLITELRKELRVSDKEHRELLAAVNSDDIIRGIREWRQAGGSQSGLLNNAHSVQDRVPSPISASNKKQKTSHAPSAPLGVPSSGPNSQTVVAGTQLLPSPAKRVAPPINMRGKKSSGQKLARVQSLKSVQYSSNCPTERGHIVNQESCSAPVTAETAKVMAVDPLIGRKVLTRWPEDNNFYEAVITNYNPIDDRHALVYDMHTENETWEWVNLRNFPPSDICWDGEDPGISHHSERRGAGNGNKFAGKDGAIPVAVKERSPLKNHPKVNCPSLNNGSRTRKSHDIEILNTDILIKEVQRVVFTSNNPNPREVEEAKKWLKVQERYLTKALERIADASDGESGGKEHKQMHGQSDVERGWKRQQQHPGRHHAGNYG